MADGKPRGDALHEQLNDPRFRALTEHAQDIIGVCDAAFRVRYVSPAIERVLGYRPDELHGVAAPELAHPDDLPRVEAALVRLTAAPGNTVSLSVRGRHKDASYRQFEIVAHNLLHDAAIGAIVMNGRDVTVQHDMLVALAESERRFRTLAENARDIVARYRLWPDAALEYVSPSVEHILGYAPSELYSDPEKFLGLIDPEDRARLAHLMSDRGTDEHVELQTLRWRHKDGHCVWAEQQTVLIRDADGRVVAAETIARDVSEKVKLAELAEQLQEARKLEAIGSLGAGIAHDFNNLLMEIFAHVSRLEGQLVHTGPGAESLLAIKDSAQRAAGLSEQLLSFAQKGVRRSVVVDLLRAVGRLERSLRLSLPEHVTLCVERRAQVARVRCDPSQLEQVLLNLAQNGRDAMPNGGTLTIRVLDGELGSVRLEVEDSGVGIAEEDIPHLFEPFFSKKLRPSSSGLGLAVVRRVVDTLGGHIVVRSRLGAGACFALHLPTVDAPVEELDPGGRLVRGDGAGADVDGSRDAEARHAPLFSRPVPRAETLLLVDDQRTIREVLGQLLRDAGYRVIEAENGAHALALSERETISILVTDMVMPDIDGAALLERLRARDPELPAVCISGFAGDEIDPRAAPNRITAFLAKPFAPEALLDTLDRLLAPRRREKLAANA